jgi:uncharacterized protein
MAVKPILLLPPSEGKEPGGSATFSSGFFDQELERARRVVKAALKAELKDLSPKRAEAIFKVRGELAERALQATKAYVAKKALVLPAYKRYSGVVWEYLDPSSLRSSERKRIWIPSALYGMTTANDLIADYRLTFLVGLDGLGNLAGFWREPLSKALANKAKGRVVIDLLPNEHRAALDDEILGGAIERVPVDFVAANGKSAAGHNAKAVKGVVARTILEEGIDALARFRWNGWRGRATPGGIEVRAPKG